MQVDANTRVPAEHVKNGEIVLNVSHDATHRLTIGNEVIQFSARFNGVSRECSIPDRGGDSASSRKENGAGPVFPRETAAQNGAARGPQTPRSRRQPKLQPTRPKLQIVK